MSFPKPVTLAQWDENLATLADTFPRHWMRMFNNLKEEGFNEAQAMDLLRTYIAASCKLSV